MNARSQKRIHGFLLVGAIFCSAALVSYAQSPSRTEPATNGARPATSTPNDKAEREELWNSAEMLRARAWLQDYCSKSAKVTPEMAKQYQQELQNMSAAQLKLWMLKFEHEEEQRQQTYAGWHQANSVAVARGFAADRAAKQSMADFNQEQTAAAGEAQQQINEQTEAAQERQMDNSPAPLGPYGYGGLGYGYGGLGYGGVHYHYHIYQ
jgi:hypothetical protein